MGGRDQETKVTLAYKELLIGRLHLTTCIAFVSKSTCTEHVQYQLLNEHSQVGLLLDAIQCSNA